MTARRLAFVLLGFALLALWLKSAANPVTSEPAPN